MNELLRNKIYAAILSDLTIPYIGNASNNNDFKYYFYLNHIFNEIIDVDIDPFNTIILLKYIGNNYFTEVVSNKKIATNNCIDFIPFEYCYGKKADLNYKQFLQLYNYFYDNPTIYIDSFIQLDEVDLNEMSEEYKNNINKYMELLVEYNKRELARRYNDSVKNDVDISKVKRIDLF